MRNIIWGSSFKRAYKRLIRADPSLRPKVVKALETVTKAPFYPSLKTHKLSGELKGLWALVVEYDCRIVFQFTKDGDILLIDIGTHDEVY
ncbi:type II toxin-antitoxin system mRNA interferase toxin, RelE/StbE family [candidate division WOR-3 bacterium]|nr:type II toxin-antitoxin system mRNA interferase toxin, RelE/StbE family [candidate division WOR-3 bacterium]